MAFIASVSEQIIGDVQDVLYNNGSDIIIGIIARPK